MNEIFGLHWNGFGASAVGEALERQTDDLWSQICVQCGAFTNADGDEADAYLEKFWVKVPALEKTNVITLRPGALSVGARLMGWDEFAYLLGFRASDEAEAILVAAQLASLPMPHEIWSHLGNPIELFVDDFGGGDAAVFTSRRDWFDTLRTAYPQAQEITPREWQQLFDDAEKEGQEYLQKINENL